MKPLICEIFKSPKDSDLYLYVDKSEGLARVPEALLERFGQPKSAMTLLLKPDRKLAKADIEKVIAAIEEKGFYLQMSSTKDDYMMAIHQLNSKMV